MYRWLSVLTCFLGIALIGADAPPGAGPSVVVFSMIPSGSAATDSGARISAALVAKLVAGGKVRAQSGPAGTLQSDYQAAAQKLGADYYVSGFVSGMGSGFTAAVQAVSVRTGVPIWSGTTTLAVADDIEGAANVLAAQVVSHDQRGFAGPGPTRPSGSAASGSGGPSPATSPSSASAAAAAAAAAAATPVPRPIGRSVAVLDTVGQSLNSLQTNYVADALAVELSKRGMVATRWHRKQPVLDLGSDLLCEDTKTDLIFSPSFEVESSGREAGTGEWTTITMRIDGYDCGRKALLARQSTTASNWNVRTAVERVMIQAADRAAAGAKIPAR